MKFLVVFIIGILLLGIGIGIEGILHPSFSSLELARKLKSDIISIYKGLTTSKLRHQFPKSLEDDIRQLIAPYVEDTFTPEVNAGFNYGTPCIRVFFIPNDNVSDSEVKKIADRLRLKLGNYFSVRGLPFKIFVAYSWSREGVTILIYYCEFDEDIEPYENCRSIYIKEKTPVAHGELTDNELDAEIRKLEEIDKCKLS